MIYQEDFKSVKDQLTKHLGNPEHPFDQIVRYYHKNGSTVWIRCRGLAIRDENGRPVRMLGAHHDLTLLKEKTAFSEHYRRNKCWNLGMECKDTRDDC